MTFLLFIIWGRKDNLPHFALYHTLFRNCYFSLLEFIIFSLPKIAADFCALFPKRIRDVQSLKQCTSQQVVIRSYCLLYFFYTKELSKHSRNELRIFYKYYFHGLPPKTRYTYYNQRCRRDCQRPFCRQKRGDKQSRAEKHRGLYFLFAAPHRITLYHCIRQRAMCA